MRMLSKSLGLLAVVHFVFSTSGKMLRNLDAGLSAAVEVNSSEALSALITKGEAWAQTCKPYPGKRVVVVQVNTQYVDLFRNWLFHASRVWNASTEQLVVAAESDRSVATLKAMSGLFGIRWDVQYIGSAGEDVTEKPSYGKGMWQRVVYHKPLQIQQLLKQNCSVLYSDTDIVWVRPVFAAIASEGAHDAYVANDSMRNASRKNNDMRGRCTCTMYFHPTVGNNLLVERWIQIIKEDPKGLTHDQFAFNKAVRELRRLEPHLLSQKTFPPGYLIDENKEVAAALHANFLVGVEQKIEKFKAIGEWSPEAGKQDATSRLQESQAGGESSGREAKMTSSTKEAVREVRA